MRGSFATAILFGAMGVMLVALRADDASDRAAIQKVLDAHGNAWTKGDAVAAASVMTEDADWVSGGGEVYDGRAAIEAAHREWLTGGAKGTRHAHPGTPKIRFIRRDVAIVDGDSYAGGFRDEQGKELPPSFSRYTAVFVKNGDNWKVAAFRSLPQLKSKLTPADMH
ncbi:MAG TPA: SgcJ/EcaC family oxidoreductase [Candidatus Acidoferrum sp.]|nr:SgcJ/EcaC family oxidoreductase [Candidatus Acidoferrum sp.]